MNGAQEWYARKRFWLVLAAACGGLLLLVLGAIPPGPSRRAELLTLLIAVLSNVLCALVGVFLVLRRQSLLGDAIGHAVLPGLVLGVVLTGRLDSPWILLAAMATGVATAALAQALTDLGGVAEDSSLGVVYTSLFALGVILIQTLAGSAHIDLDCVFAGSLELAFVRQTELPLGVTLPRSLVIVLAMLGLVLACFSLAWKELKLVTFDPALAAAMGLPVLALSYLLAALTAGVTVAAFEVVGAILVTPMLVVPAATARLLCDRLGATLAAAAALGASAAVLGYVLATRLNTSTAGTTAGVAGGQLAIVILLAPQHGLMVRWWRNAQLAVRIAAEDVIGALYREEERALRRAEGGPVSTPRPHARGPLLEWLAERYCRRQGWLACAAGGAAALSDRGRGAAQQLVRAHRLWESYLDQHFQLPADHLHEPAEAVEHFLDQRLQDELADALAGRNTDPHGKQIPDRTAPPGSGAAPSEPPRAS